MRDALGAVQSVVVFGGGSDIGQAIARRLAVARHARVVLAGRDPAALAPAAAALRAAGAGPVDCVAFDADATDDHDQVAAEAFAGGDVDVAVVAAGVLGDQAEAEADPRAAVRVLHTNTVGCASIALGAARRLRQQGHGTLVVLSSVAAERVRRSNFVYGASKAGLDGFALGLGDSLAGSGARVLVVRPGFVTTKMTAGLRPPPLSTTADAVAAAVERGLARGAEIIWVPPLLRVVMALLRHLPRRLFRALPL